MKRKRRTTVYRLKKGARQAFYGFSTIMVMFTILFVGSSSFILYQFKEYKIARYAQEVQQLKLEILRLNSQNSRYRAYINTQLLEYHRVARFAHEKLGLEESLQKPIVLKVDKDRLEYYVHKDQKKSTSQP